MTAGDTIVVCAAFHIDLGSLQVTDTLNQTFMLVGSQDGVGRMSNFRQVMFAAIGVPGGLDTLNITTTSTTIPDGGLPYVEVYAFEYRGISAVDTMLASAGVIDSSADVWLPWQAGAITTTGSDELLFGYVEGFWGASFDPSFTVRSAFHNNAVADQPAAVPGSYPVTGSANNNWASITAAFKP